MRAAKLVTLTNRGDVLHLRNNGPKALVTRMVPKQLTSSWRSKGSSDLPNSTSPVAKIPALLTTASSSVCMADDVLSLIDQVSWDIARSEPYN